MIRAIVVDDSPTARALLVAILGSDPGIQVIGEAVDGLDAVAVTRRLRPDIVTMDILMPRLDGYEATRRIMVEAPTPIVIVTSTVDNQQVGTSMQALEAGALTVLPRPPGPSSPDFEDVRRQFITTIKAMAQLKVVRRWAPSQAPARVRPPPTTSRETHARIVGIATSTGGPSALHRVLGALPASFSCPILVVQHITPGFVEGFASWLSAGTPLTVKIARAGEKLAPSHVYLAPDGFHLAVRDASTVALMNGPPVRGFRPSATPLFDSLGQVFGASGLGVVLTGMGDDGVEGLKAMRHAGGRILAQDEASCVVYGMPKAAIEAGVVDEVLPLENIAARLLEAV